MRGGEGRGGEEGQSLLFMYFCKIVIKPGEIIRKLSLFYQASSRIVGSSICFQRDVASL